MNAGAIVYTILRSTHSLVLAFQQLVSLHPFQQKASNAIVKMKKKMMMMKKMILGMLRWRFHSQIKFPQAIHSAS